MPPSHRRSLASRLATAAALAALGLAVASCSSMEWSPDPNVVHADTAFVSGGERVAVERVAPRGRGRHPAVLVLHPSDGLDGAGGDYVRLYADDLARHGYVAFVVHYFDRTHTTQSSDALEDRTWPVWTDELRDAVTFAQHDSAVEPARIGAFGFSLGGYMALALGAADPRVRGLVVVSGGFFDSLAPQVRRLPPTLLLHGAEDSTVPLSAARTVDGTLARLGTPHELVVYPDQAHGLDERVLANAQARTVRFFDERLRGRRWWSRQATAARDSAASPRAASGATPRAGP